MKNNSVDNCPICNPVSELLDKVIICGFDITEKRIDDYHFHQLYFKVNTQLINVLQELDLTNMKIIGNKIFCNCRWSTIEFME